jgi:hypothetical protein
MLTLMIFATLILASCVAAAGLIASAQNNADAAKFMAGLEEHTDLSA